MQDFLTGNDSAQHYAHDIHGHDYAGFNLLLFDGEDPSGFMFSIRCGMIPAGRGDDMALWWPSGLLVGKQCQRAARQAASYKRSSCFPEPECPLENDKGAPTAILRP